MAQQKESTNGGFEWNISVNDESSKVLPPEQSLVTRVLLGLKGLIEGMVLNVLNFLRKAWDLACNDPRKVIHGFKVGLAITAVSLFYYMRPLYEGVGGNAMWALMTVVMVFDSTVGATLCKCLNRISGTFLACFLALGVHWVADKSGEKFEPVIMGISIFIFASGATFSRFIPSIKARFDYGAMIFILTFSLVSVSAFRVDKLFDMAHQRLSTIIIGTSLCIVIIMFICPIWAGQELHALTTRNMDKLANSLDSCVAEYFNSDEASKESNKESNKNLLAYRSVLSSKGPEENMANFARWEPAHGRFGFRHPWKQYLKVGTAMRSCAYCIEALNGCVNSETKASEPLKMRLSEVCLEVSSNSSSVITELASVIKTMKKSSSIDFLVGQMNSSVQDLQNDLKSLPSLFITQPITTEQISASQPASVPLMEIVPLMTVTSLLIEISSRIEGLVDAVEELADLAQFKPVDDEKIKKDNKPDSKEIV